MPLDNESLILYNNLIQLIDENKLQIKSEIISPPRTGSSIFSRYLIARTEIDQLLNEPGSQFLSGNKRLSETYRRVLSTVNGRHPQTEIKIIIKEIAQHIGPVEELQYFSDLSKTQILLVRNPVLALESMILLTCGLVEILEGKPTNNIERYVKMETIKTHNYSRNQDKSFWQQHIEHMANTRDYSSLGDGFADFWVSSMAMFGTLSMQAEVWSKVSDKYDPATLGKFANDENFDSWKQMITHHLGTSSEDIMQLPAILHKPFQYRNSGWDAMAELFENIRQISKSYVVVDFTEFQLNPQEYLEAVCDKLGFSVLPDNVKLSFIPSETGYEERDASCHHGINKLIFRDAMEGINVRPPTKRPITIAQFPLFLRTHLIDALRIYMEILSDENLIVVPGFSTSGIIHQEVGNSGNELCQVDPVFAYIRMATTKEIEPIERTQQLGLIRTNSPSYLTYFNVIDKLLE